MERCVGVTMKIVYLYIFYMSCIEYLIIPTETLIARLALSPYIQNSDSNTLELAKIYKK
jgi:hypothetical protein